MWKDIKGFENRYQINEDGDIRNASSLKMLNPSFDMDGYEQIGIRKLGNRKKFCYKIHRLVALEFLEVPENYQNLQIDHIDRNKLNNNYLNLRWVSLQENCDNRRDSAWTTNLLGELHITKYRNGYMVRINRHDLKHRS
jgi:hypothetical protein